MRVIEPRQFKTIKSKRKFYQKSTILKVAMLVFVCLAAGSFVYFRHPATSTLDTKEPTSDSLKEQIAEGTAQTRALKLFAGNEFQELYTSYAYPNTQALQIKPFITGDLDADKRIQNIAESRGYKLSSVPVASIVKTNEAGLTDDDLIQPNALIAWQEMKKAAQHDGIELQMASAYRSVDTQRSLFLRRMRHEGIYTESVAAGYVDEMVEGLLKRVAPPGYSRHHTGYTIDLACDGIGLDAFVTTSCYGWLSKNNYENAKKFGWVPSYPDGAVLQGPEPEPWEYIWVSTYSLYE